MQLKDPTLEAARLILNAMRTDTSPGGDAFRNDLGTLVHRYQRLLRALLTHRVSGFTGEGPPLYNRMDSYFRILLLDRPVVYPRPRPLTDEEEDEANWRRSAAEIVSDKAARIFVLAAEKDGDRTQRFRVAAAAAWAWALQVERTANPDRRGRSSQRPFVRQYLKDVEAFCDRWALDAAWAVWAVIDHNFAKARFGIADFLSIITSGAVWSPPTALIVAQGPGTDSERFAADADTFSSFVLTKKVAEEPMALSAQWVPDQDEQQRAERMHGASCVVVRWDGHTRVGVSRNEVRDYVMSECATRLGRSLSKHERRQLLRQIDPQIRQARAQFSGNGWYMGGDVQQAAHAKWIARRLVYASTWEQIAADFTLDDAVILLDERTIRRACKAFAARAGLTLRSRQRRSAWLFR